MDRLAKKCVIASAALHGTLVLVLLVGPAFLPSEEPLEAKQILDFIPFKTLEKSVSGGGNPNVEQIIPVTPPKPAPAPAPAPAPQVQRREEPKPQPPKDEPKPAPKPEDTGWKARDASKIKPNLNQTIRTDKSVSKPTVDNSRNEERAKEFASSAKNVGSKAQAPVQIQLRGPGGGGIPYAGFNDALISAYMRAWSISSDLAKLNSKVVVSVTISRDGTVMSSRIQRRSGNSALDASVQDALDRVTKVGPFPDSVKDAHKTFWLEFDPRLKPMMG